jgi:alkylresorcinol/alkylpyrone synthase
MLMRRTPDVRMQARAAHMTTHSELLAAGRTTASPVHVEIAAVATAVPAHVTGQQEVAERAHKLYPQYARLEALYTNTGIERRYSVEPKEWYLRTHTWEERTQSYQRHALPLLERVATQSVAEAGLSLRDIDVIVTNTITGLSIPSLDARLMNRLGFRPNVERLPIFGLGCGGGVAGLARAARMAQARPGTNVLFLTIDLCSLCVRINDPSLTMFVAGALFGDGAAGVVLRSDNTRARSAASGAARARIGGQGEYFWSKTEHIMGWDIKNDGFGIVLSPELPTLMRERLGEALFPFLAREGLSLQDFDGLLLHPGGSKVLTTAEESLKLSRDQLRYSWSILKNYGNMSSATAMFVLKEALADGARGRYLLAAFGPGFSGYFIVLEL